MLANDATKLTTGKDTLCKVCGDRASGKHYGVASCDGCRGFFKRSIRRNLQYVCKEGGKCMIDVMRRNQCQACRFAKCLVVNMRREAVQHERAPRSSAAPPCSLISIPFDVYTQQKLLPFRPASILMPLPPTYSPSDNIYKSGSEIPFPSGYSPLPPNPAFINSPFGNQVSPLLSESSRNSSDVIQHEKGTAPSKEHEAKAREAVFESAAKLLYFAVKWTRSISHFSHLPARDQSILLENSWAELFLIMASQWGLPLECSLTPTKDLENIRHVLQQFRDLKVDVAEASCLMALVLFKPTSQMSTISYEYVALVKDQSIAYMMDKCGAFRLGHLLLLLPLLKSVALPKFIQDTFFKGTVGEVAIERLLGDLI